MSADALQARPLDPELRVFARSASDDKAPILMLLTALDVLAAQAEAPAFNLKVMLDGEEEIGSPSLAATVASARAAFASEALRDSRRTAARSAPADGRVRQPRHRARSWLPLLCCGSAVAHHGNSEFDLTVTVRYEGTIVETLWINPHTVTTIETRTATGEPITLEIEGSSPSILRTGGFSAESLPKGERYRRRQPERRLPKESAYGYEIIKADGIVIPLVSTRCGTPTSQTATSIFGAGCHRRVVRSHGASARNGEPHR